MCGYRIEKIDGCDKVECLCGYRFCYRCGVADGICDCNPGHCFLGGDLPVRVAPVRDGDGRIDLEHCIRRRRVALDRISRHRVERYENGYCTENPSLCTFNGRWLSSSNVSSVSIAILTRQLKIETVDEELWQRYWEKMSRHGKSTKQGMSMTTSKASIL